jgi:hypothetical protein
MMETVLLRDGTKISAFEEIHIIIADNEKQRKMQME